MNLCECGCGQEVRYLSSRFRPGHCSRNFEIKQKKKQTCLKNYGVENPLQSNEIKEAMKQNCMENVGVENSFQIKKNQEKYKQTCLKKYGVEHNFKVKECRNKCKQTCLKNYGVENPFQSEEIKGKIKQTNLKRYGVEFYTQSSTGRRNLRTKGIFRREVQLLNNEPLFPCIGKNERFFLNELQQYTTYNIIRQDQSFRYIIGRYPDGHIPELKLFIQFDEQSHFQDNIQTIYKQDDYDCTLQLASLGYIIFRISELDWKINQDQIISQFQILIKELLCQN